MKSALLIRLGGLGDILILGPVAKELKKRGYEVDACIGSPTGDALKFFENTDLFRKLYKQVRAMNSLDCYEDEGGNHIGVEMLKDNYDLVVDYKASIELNSHYRHMANGPGKEWFISQNSNYVNWADMMLAWAGIDPMGIANEDKRPIFRLSDAEKSWAARLLKNSPQDFLFAVQTNASSLVRTWYHPEQLPKAIRDHFPDKVVNLIFFDGEKWIHMKRKHEFPILIPTNFDPIRASAALVAECTAFIGADSGFAHVAEALSVKSVITYTTVPAWTRMKYYEHCIPLEPVGDVFNDVRCHPCFVLDRYCPRVREEALGQLTERELKVKAAMDGGRNPVEVARELGTTPQGIVQEAEMMQRRIMALFERQSPCSKTITTERILEALDKCV